MERLRSGTSRGMEAGWSTWQCWSWRSVGWRADRLIGRSRFGIRHVQMFTMYCLSWIVYHVFEMGRFFTTTVSIFRERIGSMHRATAEYYFVWHCVCWLYHLELRAFKTMSGYVQNQNWNEVIFSLHSSENLGAMRARKGEKITQSTNLREVHVGALSPDCSVRRVVHDSLCCLQVSSYYLSEMD